MHKVPPQLRKPKIDEEKQCGLHKLDKNTATNGNRKIYSDHNSISINLDFETPTEEEEPKKIITKKGYKRYRTIIEEKNVSKLLKSGDLQESYNMVRSNRNFHKNCTKNRNKKSKERYSRAAKNSQKIERRIFKHRRTS